MKNFNVEIEAMIVPDVISDLNHIIALIKTQKDLQGLIGHCHLKKLICGLSGSHIWVSYPNGNRILLITEI